MMNGSGKYEIEQIGPEQATRLLAVTEALGFVNRNCQEMHVRRLATEMKEGRWRMVYDPIRLGQRGEVIDGQHRLHAIVMSGTTQEFVVIRGMTEQDFEVIDLGKRRDGGDVLHMHGYSQAKRVAAAVGFVLRFRSGAVHTGSKQAPSPTLIVNFVKANPSVVESVRVISDLKMIGYNAAFGGMHFLLSEINQDQAHEFFARLIDGKWLGPDDTRYKLREKLIGLRARGLRISEREVVGLVLKTWNAWRSGRVLRQLAFSINKGEEIPTPI